MVFNTPEFFVFFGLVLLVYYVLNVRWQNLLLVIASYIFYGWWDWRFCILLFISTVVDYVCGLKIPGPHGKRWVWFSVVFQLSMLGFFKYFNFFEENLRAALHGLGVEAHMPMLNVLLPVGVSFYTFQTLSYTIDLWRGKLKPERNFINFAAFVSFFPHLVAGPILRASYMLPQIANPRRVGSAEISQGTYFILVGLVKKVAVADVIVLGIKKYTEYPGEFSSWHLLLAIYLFSIRIYCDFCGYTDIARGVSLFLGFRLAENFHYPYFAVGIQDFWRRWHMSLSSWLRDYLYISLGGNRFGKWNTYRNLMITMLLGGLWHGASWAFVLWGFLHGLYLSVGRMVGHKWDHLEFLFARRGSLWLLRAFGMFLTFNLVTLTWIPFVMPDYQTMVYVQELLHFSYRPSPDQWRMLVYALAVVLAIDIPEALSGRHEYLSTKPFWMRGLFYACCIALLAVTWTRSYEPFIYFQF